MNGLLCGCGYNKDVLILKATRHSGERDWNSRISGRKYSSRGMSRVCIHTFADIYARMEFLWLCFGEYKSYVVYRNTYCTSLRESLRVCDIGINSVVYFQIYYDGTIIHQKSSISHLVLKKKIFLSFNFIVLSVKRLLYTLHW